MAGHGTGIGLKMSKTSIEKRMKGTITAVIIPGGAEFRIEPRRPGTDIC